MTPQKTTIRTYINGKEASALQTEETIYWDKVSQFKAAFGNSLFALIVAILSVVLLVVRIVLKIDNRIMVQYLFSFPVFDIPYFLQWNLPGGLCIFGKSNDRTKSQKVCVRILQFLALHTAVSKETPSITQKQFEN